MEVDHDAMKRAAAGSTSSPAQANDPAASAPEMVEANTRPMVMSHQSGAVPDHYESYPEVVPPQQQFPGGAGYAQSAVSSAQSAGPYDRYQTISPPPAQQTQPLMQNAHNYHQGPIPVESEKGYYGPTLGVGGTQPPTPYSANTVGPDASASGSSHGKGGGILPAPAGYPNPPTEKKILGMKKKVFWIVLVVIILVIAGAAGGAAGAILSKNKNNNNNSNNGNTYNDPVDPVIDPNNRTSSNGDYTPFALTTGVRTLDLNFLESDGSCNAPSASGTGGLVDCHQTSRYQVRIDGNVQDGYTLSSVNVQDNSFSNIVGSPPTTDDANQTGSAWLFQVSFSQGGAGSCDANRITRYAFGKDDNVYAVGEVFTLSDSCTLQDGSVFSTGTSCTCVAVSSG